MRIVTLPGAPPLAVRLRPVTGQDELAVAPADPGAAIALLGRLASDAGGTPLAIPELTVFQADRLLAAIYDMLYGARADCRLRCGGCGEGYEFTLLLPELIAAQDAARPPPAPDGAWTMADGRRVRAPRLADLAAAEGPAALLARLVVEGDPAAAPEAANAFLDVAAPTLAVDLGAQCPHCGAAETVRFDLARYLAQRLAAERPFLLREAHLIAARYGWSHAEIMALSREDRRAFAGLIEAERTALAWRRAG